MSINIRFAEPSDFKIVRQLDPHSKYIDPKKIEQKLAVNEIIIALDGTDPIGLIKFSYFWATRPYMDLIWIKEQYRSKGFGKQLLSFFENYLVQEGHLYLMTSSEKDELAPQKWHKSQGFIPCGELTSLNLPMDDIPEIFFYKKLTDAKKEEEKLKEYPIL